MDLDTWRPTVLCLGSGGVKGLNEMGAIQWFWSNGNLEKVDTYIGSSVGAIIGAMAASGWNPPQMIENAVETTLFRNLRDVNWTQAMHEFGLVPNSSFDDPLAKRLAYMITKKIGKFRGILGMPTLKEFYEATGKRLIMVVVSLKDEEPIFMDHNSHPDMDMMIALRMTSNSPIVFGKLEHQNDYYCDGAIMVPLPVEYLDDGHTDILAIGVQDKKAFKFKKMTALGYYDRIMSLPLNVMQDYAIANSSDRCLCVIIPVSDEMSMLDNGDSVETRLEMFKAGYKYVEEFVKNKLPTMKKPVNINLPITETTLRACLRTHAVKTLLKAMAENPALVQEALKAEGYDIGTFRSAGFANVVRKDKEEADLPRERRERSEYKPSFSVFSRKPEQEQVRVPFTPDLPASYTVTERELIPVGQVRDDLDDEEEVIEIPRSAMRSPPSFVSGPPPMGGFHPRQFHEDPLEHMMNQMFRQSIHNSSTGHMGIVIRIGFDPRMVQQMFNIGANMMMQLMGNGDLAQVLRFLTDK